MLMSSSIVEIVWHVWTCGVEKKAGFWKGPGQDLWEMGQSIFNMGPERSEVPIMH
jgi:hypothetical protein